MAADFKTLGEVRVWAGSIDKEQEAQWNSIKEIKGDMKRSMWAALGSLAAVLVDIVLHTTHLI